MQETEPAATRDVFRQGDIIRLDRESGLNDLATLGIIDHNLLGRLALDLEDMDIPQKCDLKAYESIRYAPLRAHIDSFGITIYRIRSNAPTSTEV